jgi:ribosomal protein L28
MSVRGQHHKGVAGGQWKHKAQKSVKLFRVNLHHVKMMIDGTLTRVKLCTDCISKLKKEGKIVNKLAKAAVVTVKTK